MLKSMTILTLVLTLILSSAARAEDIVDAHIKAIGGAEAIAKIKTVKRTGTIVEVPVGKGSHIHRGTAAVSDQSATGHER